MQRSNSQLSVPAKGTTKHLGYILTFVYSFLHRTNVCLQMCIVTSRGVAWDHSTKPPLLIEVPERNLESEQSYICRFINIASVSVNDFAIRCWKCF
jgi:hypothetical protein